MMRVVPKWLAFREGKFQEDCSLIRLTKNGSDQATYEGPGEIRQDNDGALIFKCFCRTGPDTMMERMMGDAAIPVGKLIPPESYYSARLVTCGGVEWQTENISLGGNFYLNTGQAVVTGKLPWIKRVNREKNKSGQNYIQMVFVGQDLKEWNSLIGSEISCPEIGCSIKVFAQREADACLCITSERELTPNLEVRAIEAIRYVLAKIVHVRIIERRSNGIVQTELFSPISEVKTRLLPPIQAQSKSDQANVRRLFERYLTFVHQSQESTECVHPCSMHLRMVCEASSNSVDSEVIGLCVAVEGMANLVSYERRSASDDAIAVVQRVVARWMTKRRFGDDLRNRVAGLLSQLKNVRTEERLDELVRQGRLNRAYLRTWGRLRGRGVHPKKSTLEERDHPRFQDLLDRVHQVYVCMYQITFALIGYEGTFSNYSLEGFPVEDYPLKVQSD